MEKTKCWHNIEEPHKCVTLVLKTHSYKVFGYQAECSKCHPSRTRVHPTKEFQKRWDEYLKLGRELSYLCDLSKSVRKGDESKKERFDELKELFSSTKEFDSYGKGYVVEIHDNGDLFCRRVLGRKGEA